MKTYPRVALLIESSRTYGRGVLRGIANYAHIHGPWSIFSQERELHGGIPSWLKKWSGDGIIARIQSRRMARELARRGLPVVDVLGNEPYPGIPGFDTDSEAVARVTADFFIKAGFRELAFCGYRGIPFSDRREASLAAYLARLNRRLLVCSPRPKRLPPEDIQATEALGVATQQTMAAWLQAQRRPLAVIACNDVRALQVLHACRDSGLKVPEEVAVLGVDNDDVLCRLSEPSLTSLQPDTERLGFEAAAQLAALLQGGPRVTGIRQIPPLGIWERGSSDVIPVADPMVVQALRLIREELNQGIGVKEVLARVGRSRTDLENRFRVCLNTTIHGEILRQRLDRACQLLRQTDLRVEQVAARSGFNSSTQLCRLFQTHRQTTPLAYRQTTPA